VAHGPQLPPQSTSVSSPFFTWSPHAAAWHASFWQTPEGQVAPLTHSTHAPAALQNIVLPAHEVPIMTGRCVGLPASQASAVHSLPSSSIFVSSGTVTMLPAPSHSVRLQG
jgi:hypothetical protein